MDGGIHLDFSWAKQVKNQRVWLGFDLGAVEKNNAYLLDILWSLSAFLHSPFKYPFFKCKKVENVFLMGEM